MFFPKTYLVVFILIIIAILLFLWYLHRRITKEAYPFDKYGKLGYYKPCKYTKGECIDRLNKIRTQRSPYRRKDICVVTVSIGDRKFCKITKTRMKEYCDLYGYDLKYFTEVIDDYYPIMWQKCVSLDKVLNMKDRYGNYKYKVVAWFDDDIYLTNMKYRLEDFLTLNPKKDIFFPRDLNKYNYNHYINAGCYIMKNTQTARDFMRDTLRGMDDYFDGHFRDEANHEQSINTYLYFSKKKYADAMEVLPYGTLQSFHTINYHLYKSFYYIVSNFMQINGPWRPNDFCIHFASMDSDQRYKLCNRIDMYDKTVTDRKIAYPQTYQITRGDWYDYY